MISWICYYRKRKNVKVSGCKDKISWVQEDTSIKSGSGTPSINIINEARLGLCRKESEKSRPKRKLTRKVINLT